MLKLICVLNLLFMFNNCKNSDEIVVKYYETFSGYNHPILLKSEIKNEETIHKKAYYIGYFKNNKLIKVEKFLDNNLFFTYEYFYKNDQLVEAILINKEGKTTIKFGNVP